MFLMGSLQYWKKNNIKYLSILFTIMIGIAAIFTSACLIKSRKITELEETLNNGGCYDLAIYDVSEELKEELKRDARIETAGILYDLGSLENENGIRCTVGAMENQSTEEMVHLSAIEGRYPEKEGEIAIDRISLQCMGVQPKLGEVLQVSKKDADGNVLGEVGYVVVGLIEQTYMAENGQIYTRRNYTSESAEGYIKIDCPFAYVSVQERDSFGKNTKEHLFANVKTGEDYDDDTLRKELLEKYGAAIELDYNRYTRSHYADTLLGYAATEDGSMETANGYLSALKRIGTSSTDKDFLAKYMIPVFSILIAITVFISLYEAFGHYFFVRKRELGIYRCVGMSKALMMKFLFGELGIVILPGIFGGLLLGYVAYRAIVRGIKIIGGATILSAFELEPYFAPFIKAATPDPFFYSLGVVGIAAVLVFGIQLWRVRRLSPLEACTQDRIVSREYRKYQRLFGLNVVLLLVSISLGYLFFSTETRYENGLLQNRAEESLYQKSDYMMEKNTEYSLLSNGRELRHDAGISEESLEKLKLAEETEQFYAVIQCKGTQLVENTDGAKQTLAASLLEDVIEFEWGEDDPNYENMKLRYERDRSRTGFTEKESLYHLPVCATSQEEIEGFAAEVTDGAVHMEQINKGEEIVVAYHGEKPKVSVGETLHMTEVVYPVEADVSPGFFANGLLEEAEPDYADAYGVQYCVGRRKDFSVKVGAILYVADDHLWDFYMVDNESGINLLTTVKGLEQWELPDENYTKVSVKLKEKSDVDAFEAIWYQTLTDGKIMKMQSLEKLKGEIRQNSAVNYTIFSAMAVLLFVVSLFGMGNILTMQIVSENKRNSVLRALGMRKAELKWRLIKEQLGGLTSGCVLAVLETGILLHIRDYIQQRTEAYLNGGISLGQDWWGFYFPFHTISRADYKAPIVFTLLLTFLLSVVIWLVYEQKNKHIEIADGMKELD